MRDQQLTALMLVCTVIVSVCLLVTSDGDAPTLEPRYNRAQQPASRDSPAAIERRLPELRSLRPWYSDAEPPATRDVTPAVPRDVPPAIEQLRLLELGARAMLCY